MELAAELQKLYDSEINVRIGWLFDGEIDVRLGDEMNGFLAEETVPSVEEILPCLREAIAHFYPNSTYAASLPPEIRERATRRIFQPPMAGQSIRCPHCGSPNATMMDETFAFICNCCGASVKVDPPKVQ